VGTLEVVSLFGYSAVSPLLLTKHTPVGYRIYRYLGRRYVAPLVRDLLAATSEEEPTVVAIDEDVRHGYAHTAQLIRPLHRIGVGVHHGALRARNRVHYAGKTLAYRLSHPRDFVTTLGPDRSVILVDDIVTTGVTLQEAQRVLEAAGNRVLMAVTVADARK